MKRLALAIALSLGLVTPSFPQSQTFGSPNYVFQASNYKNITTDATFAAIKSGGGVLDAICLNNPTATEVITIYDSLTAAGTKIATITIPTGALPGCLPYFANFSIGLTVVTATAAGDITVLWK